MENFEDLKSRLLGLTSDCRALLEAARRQTGLAEASLDRSLALCRTLTHQLEENKLRVAVVGPIKSGKSSFVNALMGGDYLKRGAGVVTSIVTRVRSGADLAAELIFKSWAEINRDITQALVLFPSLEWQAESGQFDIRIPDQRSALAQALAALNPEQLLSNDARNANSVLLASYLNGFDRVCEFVREENATIRYDAAAFATHRDFAGDDNLAVYLKDILLYIANPQLKQNIEIGDCQGSDSPNPLHLAMIQDYLLEANLILYIISSRTGLRRADIRFLNIIKKMGIIDNILFVLNADLNEHGTVNDLKRLRQRVADDLALLRPEPSIYTFSALLNLFRGMPESLPSKDRQRLAQWEQEAAFVSFSDRETKRFSEDLDGRLVQESLALLLQNHVARLLVMVADIRNLAQMKQELLNADEARAAAAIDRIRRNRQQMAQIRSVIRSTLDGAIRKVRRELRYDVDRFFDPQSGEVVRPLIDFVRSYHVNGWPEHTARLSSAGFAATLYHVFQEFRQSLDAFIAESTNPEIFRFVKDRERHVVRYLRTVAEPYAAMVAEALGDFMGIAGEMGISAPAPPAREPSKLPGLEAIRQGAGLKLPPASTAMRYSAKVKTEAIMRLGAYKFLRTFKKLLRKQVAAGRQEEIQALKDGVERMKRETERSLLFHFKDYRENLKFGYIFKMVESASAQIADALLERFQTYETDMTQMEVLFDDKQSDKTSQFNAFREVAAAAENIYQRMLDLRRAVQSPP